MRKLIFFLLLSCAAVCQQVNTDVIPTVPGLNLGHSNQRWNGYFSNLNISGTCTVNGSPCLSGMLDPGSNGLVKRTALNTTATATSADVIGLFTSCSGTQYLGADGVCHNSGGSPGNPTLSFQFNNAGAFSGTTPGTNQGNYIAVRQNTSQGVSVAPTEIQVGDCGAPTVITGAATTATIAYTDVIGCTVRHDRAATQNATITIPTPTTLNNPAAIFVYQNDSTHTDTLTPATWTISEGSAAAGATLSVPGGGACKIAVDPVNGSTWKADCHANTTNFPVVSSGSNLYTEAAVAPTTTNSNSGAAVNMFTGYTLPGNTLASGHSLRIRCMFKHTTGSTSTSYNFTFGGQTLLLWGAASTGVSLSDPLITVFATGAATETVTASGNTPGGGGSGGVFGLLTVALSGSVAINCTQTAAGGADVYTAYGMTVDIF